MPSPRDIALASNRSENFDKTAEDYDASAGTPLGVATRNPAAEDYAANPVNPPEPPAPAKNLKG
jgi:hypothetical protein